jgi:hypothetical protein
VDGHRKAVHSDKLIPRGLVSRYGKVLGCRALMLLHDEQGHPLLATTHRGDTHLTVALPEIVGWYERLPTRHPLSRMVVDREGMAAPFLAELAQDGRSIVTILRSNQYSGIEPFTEIGEFVPLSWDRQGNPTREVASARYSLPLPDHPEEYLDMGVALVRALCRRVPSKSPNGAGSPGGDAYLESLSWMDDEWIPNPSPSAPTEPALVPIVTTATEINPVELAQTYIRRWPAQENIIRDWLLPLGLDTNHGYAKAPVPNSEVEKKRATLEKRLANAKRWGEKARLTSLRAQKTADRRWKKAKAVRRAEPKAGRAGGSRHTTA